MSTDRVQRALPLFGVLFTVVLVAGLALTSGEPDAGGTRSEIFSYWHGHRGVQLVSNLLLIPFGVVFLLGFTAALRRAVRSGEAGEAVYSPLILAGGVTASVGLLVTGTLGAAVTSAAHRNARDATYTLAQLQSYDWMTWMVGFAVLLLAAGVGGLRTRALPTPLALAATVLGVLFLTPIGYFALFAFPLWALATGIALFRVDQRESRRRGRSAAAAGLALLAVTAFCSSAVASSSTAPGRAGSIAFRRYFDDQHSWGAVFTIAPDGMHARQLTHPVRGVVDDSPDWAPDGSAIAFTRCLPNGGTCHIWTVSADGTGLAPIGALCPAGADERTCPDDGSPSFSPDSRQISFVQATGKVKQVPVTGAQIEHAAVAVMNRDGSERRVVYATSAFAADLDAPMISPDGKQVVFERHNSGLAKPVGKKAVFIVGIDGSNPRRLTPWMENAGDNPDWSPDGQWILFHTHVDDASGIQSQYFLIHPDGTGRTQISHFPDGTFVGSASFSPDGRAIVFAKGRENVDVYTMRVDGSHVRRVTRSRLWDSAPDWGASMTSHDRVLSASRFRSGAWRATVTAHDLGSRGMSLGCYTWARSANVLRFSKQTITGSLAQTDGPGILRAIFTAHPWRRAV